MEHTTEEITKKPISPTNFVRKGCEVIDFYWKEVEKSESKRALDLGYGDGNIVSYILDKGYNVVGIDKSKTVKKKLEKALDDEAISKDKLDLREQDVIDFDPGNKKFSCIIASYILHFLEYPQIKMLAEKLKKALAPKGIIFIKVHHVKHPLSSISPDIIKLLLPNSQPFRHFFTKRDVESLFSEKEGYKKLLKRKYEAIPSVQQSENREVCLEYVFQKQW